MYCYSAESYYIKSGPQLIVSECIFCIYIVHRPRHSNDMYLTQEAKNSTY